MNEELLSYKINVNFDNKVICDIGANEGEMINLDLSDEVVKEEKGIIIDLIRAAHSNAKSQLKSKTSDEITKATSDFGIPGFKWPL